MYRSRVWDTWEEIYKNCNIIYYLGFLGDDIFGETFGRKA